MARRGARAKKKKSKRLARKKKLRRTKAGAEPGENPSVAPKPGADELVYTVYRRLKKLREDESSQDGDKNIPEKASSVVSGASSNSPDIPTKDEHDDSAAAGMDSNSDQDTPVWDFGASVPPGIGMVDDVGENDETSEETVITAEPAIETQDAQAQETPIPAQPVDESAQSADSTECSQGEVPQLEMVSSEVAGQPPSSSDLTPPSSQVQASALEPTSTADEPTPSADSAQPSQPDGAPLERMPSGPVGETTPAGGSSPFVRAPARPPPEVPKVRDSLERLSRIAGNIHFNSREVTDTFGELGGPQDGDDNRLSITITLLLTEASKMHSTVRNRRMRDEDRRELARLVNGLEEVVRECEWGLRQLWMELEELTMEENLRNGVRMRYDKWAHTVWETAEFLRYMILDFKRHIIQQAATVTAGMTLNTSTNSPRLRAVLLARGKSHLAEKL